jgi:hypothetical protein
MSASTRRRVVHGRDRYAAFALGLLHETGSSFADSDLFVAARGVSETVIPGIDNDSLRLVGGDPEEVQAIRSVILDRGTGYKLWSEPTLPMELHMYIRQLIHDGQLYVHGRFDRAAKTEPYTLVDVVWLAPETIRRRRRKGTLVYEQFASRRAFEEPGIIVSGSISDRIVEIPADEIVHLTWPFPLPGRHRTPERAALSYGRVVEREANRTLLAARAQAEPDDTFLPMARARADAYRHSLENQKLASARIKDMLLYPGAWEAAVFPWVDEGTEFFLAERILRSRIGICQLRAHLFEQLNRQLLARWSRLNGWGSVKLELATDVFTEQDWQDMRQQLNEGTISLQDIQAAVAVEGEAARGR